MNGNIKRNSLRYAFKRSIPIMIGFFPVGIAYGMSSAAPPAICCRCSSCSKKVLTSSINCGIMFNYGSAHEIKRKF